MKAAEIRTKKPEEVEALEESLRQELSDLRMKLPLGEFRQTSRLGQLRRDIARIKTLQHEKGHERGQKK